MVEPRRDTLMLNAAMRARRRRVTGIQEGLRDAPEKILAGEVSSLLVRECNVCEEICHGPLAENQQGCRFAMGPASTIEAKIP